MASAVAKEAGVRASTGAASDMPQNGPEKPVEASPPTSSTSGTSGPLPWERIARSTRKEGLS
jgi:hypothetical protein